jgi:hypothetical protein
MTGLDVSIGGGLDGLSPKTDRVSTANSEMNHTRIIYVSIDFDLM